MVKHKRKVANRLRRRKRIRAVISGTASRPRLNVYKSNAGMFLQLIDDDAGKTLASVSSVHIKEKGTKTEIGYKMGEKLAEKAKESGIESAVFDRGGYPFHGRVKAVADAAREKGLKI